MSDILIKAVEEIVRNAKKVYEESVANLPLVEKATVCCTSSDPDDAVLEVHKNVKTRNQYNGAEGLNESDIKLQPETFGKCKCTGEECVPDILDSRWENCDETHAINGKAGVTMDSYMVCANGGLIVPVTDGQTVEKWLANNGDDLEYEDYLAYLGFPQVYIYYLLDLHAEYPNWEFEPVFTNVDFEEFVQYQMKNNTKCADINDNVKYCGVSKYPYETSSRYRVVDETALRYLMHPGRVLISEDYMLQFLKADQILPQDYAASATKKILSGKRDIGAEVERAILNSTSCFNPVLMSTIYRQENGPAGEDYQGAKIYNLFNIGANTGREDSKKYAFEHNWFTAEDCIKGSDDIFQKYLDRGQNTLYAMDWHYQGYADGTGVRQYATLVNDADNKAGNLKSEIPYETLNQDLKLSIPVYNDLPQYQIEDLKEYFE